MKTRKNIFYVFFILLTITIMFTVNATSIFPDIEGNLFEEYITNLFNDEIISGYSDGLYHPEKEITRGAMAKFVRRGFNIPKKINCGDFPDVPKNHTFYEDITSFKCNGIIDGYTDGTYKPANGVTRGAVTKYVSNALEFNQIEVNLHLSNDFPDVPKNHTFYKYISYLATVEYNNESVIKGFSDGTYRPDIVLKRGPMAKIIDLSRNIIQEEDPIGPTDPILNPTTNPNLSIEFTTIPTTVSLGSEFEIIWHYEDDESLITSCTSWSKIKNSSLQTKPAFEGQEVLLEIPMTGGRDPLTFEGTRTDNEIRPVGTTAELIEIISDNTGEPLTYSGITLGANYYETYQLSTEVESGDVIEFFVSCRDDYTGDVISTSKEITITDSQGQCVGEGELVTLWDEVKTCCTGLVEIANGVLIGDQCAYPTDGSYYCSDCGNGTCESWENICNCEVDCL